MTPSPLRRIASATVVAGLTIAAALSRAPGLDSLQRFAPLLAQARDALGPPPTGNAIIAGTVVTDDDSQRPVKRALVTVSGSELRGQRMAMTNDAGHFELPDLPAGTFTVTVTKPGYVTTFYGSHHPGRQPGTPIALANGQRRELSVREMRGAIVTGSITDTFGRGLPDVRVSVLELRSIGGDRRLVNVSTNGPNNAATDEHGVYRIWGLPPGSYVISATPNSLPNGISVREITSTDMEWVQQQLAPNHGPMTPAPDAGRAVGYATVYYPGVVDPGSAPQIEIKPGEEHGGLSFSLQLVPTATIAGTIIGIDGQPVLTGAQVMLSQGGSSTNGGIALAGFSSRGIGVDRTGHFTLSGVTPGVYTLTARASSRNGVPPPPPAPPPPPGVIGGLGVNFLPAPMMGGPGGSDLWASVEVALSGSDQSGIVLPLRPGMTLSGRLAFEGASKPPSDLTRVRVGLNVLTMDGLAANVGMRPADANGTFTITGVTPGHYRPTAVIVTSLATPGAPLMAPAPQGPDTWRLKSVMWQGRDLLDIPLDVRPNEDISEVTFTYTDTTTELSGSLVNGTGGPALGYFVIVFPVDQTMWVPNGRRIRQAQPTADGSFKLTNLPAGTYYVGAVTDLEPSDLSDPSFLEQLSAASLKVTVADGAKVVQNLKLRDPG